MKTLKEYITEISDNQPEVDMKPHHIMAEQNNGDEALWNSTGDRWSRNAKHQMNLSARLDVQNDWQQGDVALYEGQQVEVSIPQGPNSTVGILIQGKTRMVGEAKLTRIEEGVMGGMTQLSPINRMMQLAGISVPVTIDPDSPADVVEEDVEMIVEADPSNMFNSLLKANSTGEFKNNPTAARVATVGQVMVGLESQISELRGKVPADIESKLDASVGIGALMIKTARNMLRPETAEE